MVGDDMIVSLWLWLEGLFSIRNVGKIMKAPEWQNSTERIQIVHSASLLIFPNYS